MTRRANTPLCNTSMEKFSAVCLCSNASWICLPKRGAASTMFAILATGWHRPSPSVSAGLSACRWRNHHSAESLAHTRKVDCKQLFLAGAWLYGGICCGHRSLAIWKISSGPASLRYQQIRRLQQICCARSACGPEGHCRCKKTDGAFPVPLFVPCVRQQRVR